MNRANLHASLQRISTWLKQKRVSQKARITYGVIGNVLLLFFVMATLGVAFVGATGAGYFASLVKEEPIRSYESMERDIYNYEQTSELYFSDNVYLGKMRTDLEREEVSLENISPYVREALIATEDEYFFEHEGVVPKAIARALIQEFTNSSVQTGGSTLTQQLIKNQILTNEVSFDRKAKEILLALRLERFFEKDQILEAYLNVSTFGRNANGRNIAGIQAAAKGVFGVEAKDLTLPQAAYLAGLPQSPFGYTPFTNKGEVKQDLSPSIDRMKTVLERMKREEFITEKEFNEAISYDIKSNLAKPIATSNERYPWLSAEIEERSKHILKYILAEQNGITREQLDQDEAEMGRYETLASRALRQNGYRIHTTIDKQIFDKMEEAKDSYQGYGPTVTVTNEDGEAEEQPVQVGSILIENSTGKILSFTGGRDFETSQINHATQAYRSNGSTMKPLLSYAVSYELGEASPGTVWADIPVTIQIPGQPPYEPGNYNNRFHGLVSSRFALEKSYNIPAIQQYRTVINQSPLEYLKKMGFSRIDDANDSGPAVAIGGLTNGVTVEQNVNAFATFANQGKFIDAYLIERIEDTQGNILFEHKPEPVDVFSPQTAYLTLDVMRGVLTRGTAGSVPGQLAFSSDWAGKTGTSQETKDVWFVGTNPNVTFGTWLGYKTPRSLEARGVESASRRNLTVWSRLINAAYEAKPEVVDPNEQFKMPGGIVRRSYCAISGLLPSEACSQAGLVETDIFNAKFAPTKTDDSLINTNYVTIGDKKYIALDSTPAEFVQKGLLLAPEYVESLTNGQEIDLQTLLPDNPKWNNIILADDTISDDGSVPQTVNAVVRNSLLAWTPSTSPDVVGYYVYRVDGGKITRVAAVKAGEERRLTVSSGTYVVRAVDVAGKESANSNQLTFGQSKPADPPATSKPPKEKPPESNPPADPPTDGGGDEENPGDGNGDGNGEEPTDPTDPSTPPEDNPE
ncbi:transglycosylase domain-containing protein [Mangrovibacillus cuniculi]|uniref:Penicillin-binding protein n=1 Tax=Mangrovibacillus cuniculi TaxID=2593652 RepID=A0A7S8CC53_9BACI|nr:transglycosylase domain-containing protein [Mangrovibacillus cuniculi]QPC47251.1 penicillin-binding protein [Mangrovibacillus cuniculi]